MRIARNAFFWTVVLWLMPAPMAAGEDAFAVIDERIGVAGRLIDGGFFNDALSALRVLLDDPTLSPDPENPALDVAVRSRREAARFFLERARLGSATAAGDILDVAGEFVLLNQNRYRLAEPAYAVQSAYWAGRAFQEAGDFEQAVAMYGKVGGALLPDGMEGDAARRMSEALRRMAESLPYPGTGDDRERRRQLLDQAINELARARQAFPVGRRRKELELDLIALRLARREPDYIREAIAEADAFLAAEAVRDDLRARAVLYRGVASERLGNVADAAKWFREVLADGETTPADRREARLNLAIVLREQAENLEPDLRRPLLREAADAFTDALRDAPGGAGLDQARILLASTLIDMGSPREALDAVGPLIAEADAPRMAFLLAGSAELSLGRMEEALAMAGKAAFPSTRDAALRLTAASTAARAARGKGDFGLALAFHHETARLLRRRLAFSSLLEAEFTSMETLLRLGKAGGPVSLSADVELLRRDADETLLDVSVWRADAAEGLCRALGGALSPGASADAGFGLALAAERAHFWSGAGKDNLEAALGIIRHLRNRRPPGITESALLSREGEAFHALARARVEHELSMSAPDEAEIERILGDFTRAATNYRTAAGGAGEGADLLDQGVVDLESGEFLLRLADRWGSGPHAGAAMNWRTEARRRIEASLVPFNRIIRNARQVSPSVMRARWSLALASELLGEWRAAAAGYSRLMNDSEAPRILRVNSARRWARTRLASPNEDLRGDADRIAVFAAVDAETALLSGELAEAVGEYSRAYSEYLAAADPDAPSMPPAMPGRPLLAAQKAAGLALGRPGEVAPDSNPETLRRSARELLERTAYADLSGSWAEGILGELVGSWLQEEPDGWRTARQLAMRAAADSRAPGRLRRAMLILAAEALHKGGEYAEALDSLDEAREFLSGDASDPGRTDAARIVFDTATAYQGQGRVEDALRAYAETFATYPDAGEYADRARAAAARLLLSQSSADEREVSQARSILAGLRDRALAEEILGGR